MSFYLAKAELLARIRLGKEVAQWLAYVDEADYTIIKWLSIRRAGNQYYVLYNESFDEGDEDFWDVVEFTSVDPDAEEEALFSSVEDAIAFAVKQYGASTDKFVAGSMICEEYGNYLKGKSQPIQP